ncbi:hypothetical protein AB46_3910 [Escherichia coli 3-267-03_S1_C2]|nr:hypothetical protein PPECC33_04189 [Escherichia coli PCN033]KDU01626.1 hypothetical protein AB46_3910 [Escherichia coli 3-267-03_S1_C2]KEJ71659.1 hypothetical protein AB67_4497 [Escherichia coli 5-366-08_S1_C3]RCH08867.1 hypothetical protein CSC37_2922 [Escherichia coli]
MNGCQIWNPASNIIQPDAKSIAVSRAGAENSACFYFRQSG